MTAALAFESIARLGARLRARELSARELVELFLTRCERLNPQTHAFIELAGERALAQAAKCAFEFRVDGPMLAGIPYACKDLIDVEGLATTGGSRVLADNVASEDAELVQRMDAQGAIMLGKTNLHEFAFGATGENSTYGTAVNAYDTARLACGSSSGSAAAVAFGLCPAAFGTDTGGSVRVPAVVNGLVGFKPTRNLISTEGVIPYCWSLDHVGTITRTAEDAAILLDAVTDRYCTRRKHRTYRDDVLESRLAGLRIGIPRPFFFERADGEILAGTDAVRGFFERNGARAIEVELPSMEHARTVSLTVQMPEALSFHGRYLAERGDRYGPDLRAGLALGQCLLAEHYVRAKRFMEWYRRETDRVLTEVDVLLTPAVPIVAPPIGQTRVTVDGVEEPTGNALTRYTTFFNMTGHPAVTFPTEIHSCGLPMGAQIVGRHFEDGTVLAAAAVAAEAADVPPPSRSRFGI